MNRILLIALLLLPAVCRAQTTITQQPLPQTVLAPATATFMVAVSPGPCRYLWLVNGKGHYGSNGYSIPSTSADYHTGSKVQVQIYGCPGQTGSILSAVALLTVNKLPSVSVSTEFLNDDGTFPPTQLVISLVNADSTQTPVLSIATNANGIADGSFLFDKMQLYAVSLTVSGNTVSWFFFGLTYPQLSSITASVTLKAGTLQISKSNLSII